MKNEIKIKKMPTPAERYQVQRAFWEKRLGSKFDAKKFNQDFATGLARQDY